MSSKKPEKGAAKPAAKPAAKLAEKPAAKPAAKAGVGHVTRWIKDEADVKGSSEKWIKKFKAGNFSGDNIDDVLLFFGAMAEFGLINKNYRDSVDDAILQYGEIAQFFEVRNTNIKVVMIQNEKDRMLGIYEGSWKDVQAEGKWKNPIFVEMVPEAMKQIMAGNANTDSYFFKGDLTVQGPIKLAVIGREWVTTYYEENGIDT
nr:hypothetical protein [Candidatus Sigynarchaeota archaeon]